MVAVFAVFASLSSLDIKQMGVGLAIAVLLDATIIRGVLLPATMTLLGRCELVPPARSWAGCRGGASRTGGPCWRSTEMTALLAPFREAATYRSLLFLSTALVTGAVALAVLVTGWIAAALARDHAARRSRRSIAVRGATRPARAG